MEGMGAGRHMTRMKMIFVVGFFSLDYMEREAVSVFLDIHSLSPASFLETALSMRKATTGDGRAWLRRGRKVYRLALGLMISRTFAFWMGWGMLRRERREGDEMIGMTFRFYGSHFCFLRSCHLSVERIRDLDDYC